MSEFKFLPSKEKDLKTNLDYIGQTVNLELAYQLKRVADGLAALKKGKVAK